MSINDNEPGAQAGILRSLEAHGQAALILVETLIHALIAKAVITTEESLDIVMSAIDVQADYVAEAVDGLAREMRHSQALLAAIADSLRTDITDPVHHPTKPALVDINDLPRTTASRPIDPVHRTDGNDE